MKIKALLFITSASLLHAGAPDLETTLTPEPEPWIKPVIDIRARYEFRNVDPLDSSNALTVRERLGLKTKAWNGFSAYIEGEFTQSPIDDYNGGAVGVSPTDPANTVIADPQTNEFNQGYLQYEGYDTVAKVGRQRIIYDNAAFIGNVGWRQNEQTFDAISLTNKSLDKLTLNYAYIGQVNRIYGSDADGPLLPFPASSNVQDLLSDVHLFNGSYTGIEGITLGGYAYIMNFKDRGNWDNNTFGISAKGKALGLSLYGELAYQDKAGVNSDGTAFYEHGIVTKEFGNQSIMLGVEHLDAGFKTPLATVHSFNGYADAFIGGRIEGSQNGLTDVYLSYTTPLFYGIKWTNVIHALGDDSISAGYGYEIDSVLTKKFNDNFSALAKFAHFESEGDPYTGGGGLAGKPAPTTSQFSVEMDYTF